MSGDDWALGDLHDDRECREVLEEVWLFLDGEPTGRSYSDIRRHLDDCTPCLRKYGIEREVKAIVARCCGKEDTPVDLRDRVLAQLRSVSVVEVGDRTTVTTHVETVVESVLEPREP